MPDEITISIDGVKIGTAEDVKFSEIIDPDAIRAICDALAMMNESCISFSKAVYEALEDERNPNHEIVTALIRKKEKSKEGKLPKKYRKGWK